MLATLVAMLAGRSLAADTAPTTVGPFTIEGRSRRILQDFPNISSNPFARTTVSDFRVLYKGKPVVVGDAKAIPTASGRPRAERDAALAVLVPTTGAWLISGAGSMLTSDLVAPETDILRWQWLDSANASRDRAGGQSAIRAPVRAIADGRLLLIGRRAYAIDTLRYSPVPVTEWERVQKLDGFHAGNVSERTVAGRTQVVYVGSRSAGQISNTPSWY
jgi:hypothetical protein